MVDTQPQQLMLIVLVLTASSLGCLLLNWWYDITAAHLSTCTRNDLDVIRKPWRSFKHGQVPSLATFATAWSLLTLCSGHVDHWHCNKPLLSINRHVTMMANVLPDSACPRGLIAWDRLGMHPSPVHDTRLLVLTKRDISAWLLFIGRIVKSSWSRSAYLDFHLHRQGQTPFVYVTLTAQHRHGSRNLHLLSGVFRPYVQQARNSSKGIYSLDRWHGKEEDITG
jgi:hypothetical protein